MKPAACAGSESATPMFGTDAKRIGASGSAQACGWCSALSVSGSTARGSPTASCKPLRNVRLVWERAVIVTSPLPSARRNSKWTRERNLSPATRMCCCCSASAAAAPGGAGPEPTVTTAPWRAIIASPGRCGMSSPHALGVGAGAGAAQRMAVQDLKQGLACGQIKGRSIVTPTSTFLTDAHTHRLHCMTHLTPRRSPRQSTGG